MTGWRRTATAGAGAVLLGILAVHPLSFLLHIAVPVTPVSGAIGTRGKRHATGLNRHFLGQATTMDAHKIAMHGMSGTSVCVFPAASTFHARFKPAHIHSERVRAVNSEPKMWIDLASDLRFKEQIVPLQPPIMSAYCFFLVAFFRVHNTCLSLDYDTESEIVYDLASILKLCFEAVFGV